MYQLRVWKYLNNNNKQLKDIIKSDDLDFIKLVYIEFKNLYNYYNYAIEKIGF